MPWVMQIRTACSIGPWPVKSQCWLWLSTHHVDHSTSSIWQNQWELNSNMLNERFLSSTQDILWKLKIPKPLGSVQFSSVTQSCSTLCNPMNHSTPGLPVHHQLPEFTQTHVHWVSDAIQPSHPLSSPSPPAPNPSQHQGLFQWVNSSHEVAKVLEFQL